MLRTIFLLLAMLAYGFAVLSGAGVLLAWLLGSGASSVTSQQVLSDIGRHAGYMVLALVIGHLLLRASRATQPDQQP